MTTDAQMIQVALLALLAGVALPLLVQLFVTLRSLQRVAGVLDRHLEKTLADLSEVATNLRQSTAPNNGASALVAALGPALVAALAAFRSSASTRSSEASEEERSP